MSRTRIAFLVAVLLAAFLAAPAVADVIYLKDGRKFSGKVVSETDSEVKFKTVGGVLTFKKSEVESIERKKTKGDEYKERRAKIEDDDIDGLLDLARWCEEENLISQKRQLYRELTRMVPDHPQVRREMGQIYQDGKWVKQPKDYVPPTVTAGERKEIKGASVVLPKGWKVEMTDQKITATGPDPYATAPVLTVTFSDPIADPAASFPEKEKWAKPTEVKAAGLAGLKSARRHPGEAGVSTTEILAVLSGADRGMTVRLVTLAFEEKTNGAAVGMVLDSLKIKAPPADWTNDYYKYSLNIPKSEGWWKQEDDEHDFHLGHDGDEVEDFARLSIVAGDKGEEFDQVKKLFTGLVESLKEMGDITKQEEIAFAGEKAQFVDGTFLAEGFPNRRRILSVTHGTRMYVIYFTQHEFGAKRTDEAWDIVLKSFRFLD